MKFAIFGNKHQTRKSESIAALFEAITRRGDSYAIDKPFYDFLCAEQIADPAPQELITDNNFTADVAISFGGDGTLLRTASRVGDKQIPLLGINAGRLGFLTATSNDNLDYVIEKIHNGEFDIEQRSLYEAMKVAKAGNRIGDIGHAVEDFVISNGFSVVKTYTGHGVGAELHEDPEIPNFGRAGRGARLYPGMTLAIEPMVNAGVEDVRVLRDGWTVVTLDGKLSAHYENTIAITESDPIILTDAGLD